jgi:hypothetical protein
MYRYILTSIGWWLAESSQGLAWVPAAYVEEIKAPASVPAPREAAPMKPTALQSRDLGMSLAAHGLDHSRSSKPTYGLAGSLAQALRSRETESGSGKME